jgi:hypothetical protein
MTKENNLGRLVDLRDFCRKIGDDHHGTAEFLMAKAGARSSFE